MYGLIAKSAALLCLICLTSSVQAQTDPAAKAVLQQVTETYKGARTITADFTLSVQQAQQRDGYTESGQILMEPGANRYHITMTDQVLISDGKTQWMVLRDVGEVQISEVDRSEDAISPANLFSFYNKGYKYVSAPDEKAGNTTLAVVELSPEDVRSPYFKIRLRTVKSTHLVHDVTIFDKSGIRYTYALRNTKFNSTIEPTKFIFRQSDYPGLELVDLR